MLISAAKIAVSCLTLLLVRVISLLFRFSKTLRSEKGRTSPCATCIILGSGGHTSEMFRLLKALPTGQFDPRIYVMAQSDHISDAKMKEFEEERLRRVPNGIRTGKAECVRIPRAREVGQPFSTVLPSFLRAVYASFAIFWKHDPELIICNGPGTCLPICLIAYALRILFIRRVRIVYVESYARVSTLSFTGKIMYWIADRFIVQWYPLREKYWKAEYLGRLV
ncbi:oligosaccharide biosynthesis protein Alg14-like protein [Polychytrium aggregatum]|uniref:oligosaccharide biosynthesis protein Alg14-like protein n=1 Tax=Polychytrium aggregatum TaxID=110093 RepID=UPI0022FE4A9B|nr:oligosaccharide biosynthesis protein Alg14-like protein [Polychytrium aggregatum]KAI9205095.1 oligosaccharide biosynthesis protein Alg14-like protein [Polychytrium aggregatum]